MIYFKDKKGDVSAYESEADAKEYGAAGLVKMTPAEVEAHLAPSKPSREHIEVMRLEAYGNRVTGSDRFFAEAARLKAIGANQSEIDAVVAAGTARFSEIQAQYPWSES